MRGTSGQASQQYEEMLHLSNNCLVHLGQLRNRMTRLHNLLFQSRPPSEEERHTYLCQIEQLAEESRDCYDNLASYASRLPNQLPQMEPLNRLRSVFQEEQLDEQAVETVEDLIDCENWNEENFRAYTYLGEFLRLRRRPQSSIAARPLPLSSWSTGISPHAQFELAFAQYEKELVKNKIGIYPTVLERTAAGSVIELKFGVLFEKQIVVTQKMLAVENSGVIESVVFVAPHEEWSFCTDFGEDRVDLNKPSKYIVYQKLSAQANFHLMQTINAQEFRWTPQTLHQFSTAFGQFQHVFQTRCIRCK